jgi:hypothetical protein
MTQVHPQGATGWQEPRIREHNCLLPPLVQALSNLSARRALCSKSAHTDQYWSLLLPALQRLGPEGVRGTSPSPPSLVSESVMAMLPTPH